MQGLIIKNFKLKFKEKVQKVVHGIHHKNQNLKAKYKFRKKHQIKKLKIEDGLHLLYFQAKEDHL